MSKHFKARKYDGPVEQGKPWTTREEDICLEMHVRVKTAGEMGLIHGRLAIQLARGKRTPGGPGQPEVPAGNAINRYLWGLATGYKAYAGPETPASRTQRGDDVPETYGEVWLAKIAACTKSEEAGPRGDIVPDAAYLAKLVGRSEAWAAKALVRFNPRLAMGEGLGACKQLESKTTKAVNTSDQLPEQPQAEATTKQLDGSPSGATSTECSLPPE